MLYVNRPGFQTYRMEPQSDIDEEYLQRRIKEEAGPVKTYPIVEWFERQTPHYRRGKPFVVLTEEKIRMSRAAHQALGEPRFVRIGWDNIVNGLVLTAGSEEDERSFSVSRSGRGSTVQFGSSALMRRIVEKMPLGKYGVTMDGNRLLVRPEEEKEEPARGGRR